MMTGLLALCAFFTCCTTCDSVTPHDGQHRHHGGNSTLDKAQVEKYVEHLIDTLLYDSKESNQDRKKISKHVTKKLLVQTPLERAYGVPLSRTQSEVYQAVLSGIVDFVEKKSFQLAKSQTGDYHTTVKVAEGLRNEAATLITSSGTIGTGALGAFVGKELETRVHQACRHHGMNHGHNHLKRYDEKCCRICFNRFGPAVPWIYLTPCGHDMCTGCAHSYFIVQGKNRCPACNQTVDMYKVGIGLALPGLARR